MNKYRVRVYLDVEYDEVNAESEKRAVALAIADAPSTGNWQHEVELLKENIEEEQ